MASGARAYLRRNVVSAPYELRFTVEIARGVDAWRALVTQLGTRMKILIPAERRDEAITKAIRQSGREARRIVAARDDGPWTLAAVIDEAALVDRGDEVMTFEVVYRATFDLDP